MPSSRRRASRLRTNASAKGTSSEASRYILTSSLSKDGRDTSSGGSRLLPQHGPRLFAQALEALERGCRRRVSARSRGSQSFQELLQAVLKVAPRARAADVLHHL
mmetsp:Transcript_4538/g.15682  ORF Transcript_4538/g.15682 Transcript_4538/m.15682 type:complete len:105 (-) Transcript_4538:88-402(-)